MGQINSLYVESMFNNYIATPILTSIQTQQLLQSQSQQPLHTQSQTQIQIQSQTNNNCEKINMMLSTTTIKIHPKIIFGMSNNSDTLQILIFELLSEFEEDEFGQMTSSNKSYYTLFDNSVLKKLSYFEKEKDQLKYWFDDTYICFSKGNIFEKNEIIVQIVDPQLNINYEMPIDKTIRTYIHNMRNLDMFGIIDSTFGFEF